MKIIIAGAGEVGTHLAKMLSREEQDIILIDNDSEKLQSLDSNYNLMTLDGSPTSFSILKQAGVQNTDLFIAVTPFETRNITACTIASSLGAKKTVARIDNFEYLRPENKEFFKNLGVDELIYPEFLAAQEIINAMRHTWARNWFELCNGAVILIGVKVHDNAQIVGRKLYELTDSSSLYHISAIKRKHETIIPRGGDEVKLGDIVYFTTTPEYIEDIRILTGKRGVDVKDVMIMGGSRIALRVANDAPSGIDFKILEIDRDRSYYIAEKVDDAIVIQGDARDVELLKEEGIKDIDVFIALSESSETNILTCLSAKELGVPKTIAEVENIQFISTAEGLNIGTIINKKLLAASWIFQLLLDSDTSSAKCLAMADAEVAELVAKPGSKITQSQVKDLQLPKDITIGGLTRDGKGMVVTGTTRIEPGDHVVIFCLDTALHKLEKLFN